ncbi:hypothetical protein FOA52_016233 [Chlamydomonas sp. UWO 241]|nr:hypothetical protein FOA52_016233 [Chlamydomonas sp. UWO 241]
MALAFASSRCASLAVPLSSTKVPVFAIRSDVRMRPVPSMAGPAGLAAPSSRGPSMRARVVAAAASSSSASPTVKVIIQGRKLQVTDAIRAYVADKLSKACEHFSRAITKVEVTLSARGGDTGTHGAKEQTVQVTIHVLRNGVVRVEEKEESLYAAIDLVCDKVQRKLAKVKGLAIEKSKWPGHAGPTVRGLEDKEFKEFKEELISATQVFQEERYLAEQFASINKAYPATVRREKVVELDLMSVDEAIDAMEAVGHDFFVFREMETDTMQIVYRRQAEGYGVLVPRARA